MTSIHPGNGMDEPVLFPDLPIIDSHIHLWNCAGYDYFVADFLADVATGHNVEASVYVECGMAFSDDPRPGFAAVGETEYVHSQIAEGARINPKHRLAAGVLGCIDLMLGDAVAPVIEAHAAAGKGLFKGVRSRIAWDSDPVAGYGDNGYYPRGDIVNDPLYLAGAKHVLESGHVLELWGLHPQMEAIRTFAAKIPDHSIVINHVGGPLGVGAYAADRKAVFRDWSAAMHRLAELPNVQIKIGGLGITRMGFDFPGGQATSSDQVAAAWSPYVETCIEAFGPSRAIFGSNYPVDRRSAPYPMLLNAYKKMLSGLSAAERAAVFAENARAYYKL